MASRSLSTYSKCSPRTRLTLRPSWRRSRCSTRSPPSSPRASSPTARPPSSATRPTCTTPRPPAATPGSRSCSRRERQQAPIRWASPGTSRRTATATSSPASWLACSVYLTTRNPRKQQPGGRELWRRESRRIGSWMIMRPFSGWPGRPDRYSDAMSAGPPGPQAPVTSVTGAIARMAAIDARTPAADGLACFNRMYLQVTQDVNQKLARQFFADPDFMTRLDVVFANLYFGAVDAAAEPATVPLAWRPLIAQRATAGIEPIQFTLAGMNAHTCTELGTAPAAGGHLADYQKVDQLLDTAEQSVRQSFESAPELAVDRHLQAVNNLVANWTIGSARDLAWTNSLLLWQVRDDPVARGLLLGGLAAATAAASRLLLVAV